MGAMNSALVFGRGTEVYMMAKVNAIRKAWPGPALES
jgi:hypothetical protein